MQTTGMARSFAHFIIKSNSYTVLQQAGVAVENLPEVPDFQEAACYTLPGEQPVIYAL